MKIEVLDLHTNKLITRFYTLGEFREYSQYLKESCKIIVIDDYVSSTYLLNLDDIVGVYNMIPSCSSEVVDILEDLVS